MTRKDALALIFRQYPGMRDARLTEKAIESLYARQLQAAEMRYEGWPWLRTEALIQFDGGYRTGKLSVTQDSANVTLTDGGTWPSDVVGWILAPQGAKKERYTVKTRSSDTVIVLDREYIGETETNVEYAVYDRRGYLPIDYYQGEILVAEAAGGKVGVVSLAHLRAGIPKSTGFGDIKVSFLTETTKSAYQTTGTVTLTAASTQVTLDGATWPAWVEKGHFLRFAGESMWYKINTRDSDTVIQLDRAYGGENTGASQTYELDPPGSYQIEYEFPRLDEFTIRLSYIRIPQETINDSDLIEGPEGYARAICDLAAADMLSSLPTDEVQQYQSHVQSLLSRGTAALEALMAGRPEPNQDPVCNDIRYNNIIKWG